ncbi:MFS transporter [Streptomyces roseolus]|uniref:MFS transporter n=1 Tax=Streptomyces roseolus TaxID=67358 RepID=UPI00167B805D|nr:MFS transporter [Streptomyces roseolus]GGR22284.1 MFS transporter [Streptomyces roseolus]
MSTAHSRTTPTTPTTQPASDAPPAAPSPSPSPSPATLAVTALATGVALMNYTAPMATLPEMAEAFRTPPSAQAWLLNGTPLGLAVLLLVAGALADAHGRRRVFLLGTLALGVTTALGAFAGSTVLFTAARIAQGAASAAVLAGSLGLLADAYPSGRDRIRATGVWGASVSGGIALGPLLAGALALVDWRSAYAVLGAAALVTAAIGARALTAPAALPAPGGARGRRRPDLVGATALALALGALLTALTLGRDGWLRPAPGLLLLAAVALTAVFLLVERRVAAPMIDPGMWRRPAFRASTVGALFTGLAVIGMFSVLPALFQRGSGLSALAAAALFALWSGAAFVVALQARRLAGRLSAPYQLACGFALSAAGVLLLLGTTQSAALPWPRLVAGLVVAGAGSGLLNAALPRLAVDSVPPERAAMGSGANNTARYIGSAAGVSLMLALSAATPDAALVASAALALAGAVLTVAGSPGR